MKLVCSRCRKKLGEKEPLKDASVEITMCVECLETLDKQWRGMTVGEYLDTLDAPIMLVNEERRMISCNKKAEKALGKKREVMRGLMAGEFLECHNSVLAEGCGKSIHCSACVIRQSLELTINSGEPVKEVTAYLNTMEHGIPVVRHIKVSTEKEGQYVRLQIHGITDELLKGPEKTEDVEPGELRNDGIPHGAFRVNINRTASGAPMVSFEQTDEDARGERKTSKTK